MSKRTTFRFDGATYPITELTKWAHARGVAAHGASSLRWPGADADLMAKTKEPGENACALMAAWLMGYDSRVVAALVSL
jgi:hypothetical protein